MFFFDGSFIVPQKFKWGGWWGGLLPSHKSEGEGWWGGVERYSIGSSQKQNDRNVIAEQQ